MFQEFKQVDSFNFAAQPKPSFAIEQSKDDLIGLMFDNGVLVLKLQVQSDSPNMSYCKYFIKVSLFNISAHLGINLKSILHFLTLEEIYNCLLDTKLTSLLDNCSKDAPQPISIKWSPVGAIGFHSLLCVLTNAGALEVFIKVTYKSGLTMFQPIVNITQLHIDEFKATWTDVDNKGPQQKYQELLKRLQNHVPTAMVWSNMCSERNVDYCVLAVSQFNGHISFWRLDRVSQTDFSKAQFYLVGDKKVNAEEITSMHWISLGPIAGLLIIGSLSGSLIGLPVESTSKYKFKCGEEFVLHKSSDMEVLFVDDLKTPEGLFIFAVHQSHLFIHAINPEGKFVDSARYDVGNLCINSIQKCSDDTLLVMTQTGALKELKFALIEAKIQIEARDLCLNINWSRKRVVSLCSSRNNAIVTAIIEDCAFSFRKSSLPTEIVFFANMGLDYFDILMKSTSESLKDYQDSLEVLRMTSLVRKELPFSRIPQDTNYDSLTLSQLKRYYFISKISEVAADKLESVPTFIIKPSNDLLIMINIKLTVYLLQSVLKKIEERALTTEFHRECIHFGSTYLKQIINQKFLNEHNLQTNFTEEILDVLLKCKDLCPPTINCIICDSVLESVSCINDHADNRCAVTMTQIRDPKYKCHVCKRFVCANAIAVTKSVSCPYCDCVLDEILYETSIKEAIENG